MNLYLIRHGDAEKIALSKSDFERELTSKGRELTKKSAEAWKKIIKSFDVIASSPLIRAVQTAEIVADVFDHPEKIITDKKITAGTRPEELIDFIRSINVDNIAVVGHEPDMSNYVSAFTSSSGMFLEFKKGTIAKINFEGRVRLASGTLEFLIPPKVFE
jgi:phosphohistidine phosphatase